VFSAGSPSPFLQNGCEKYSLKIVNIFSFLLFSRHLYLFFIKIFCEINFETNDSDINFILSQRRFDAFASFSS
jgi:hypothetical protein